MHRGFTCILVPLVSSFGAHKTQAHLPLSPSLPPLPSNAVPPSSTSQYRGAPTEVVYGQDVQVDGNEDASVQAALLAPLDGKPDHFHEWSVNHPGEGLSYFECPLGFDFRPSTKSCIMISYSAPTESCPYGSYRDKVTKHCVTTDSVAPDRTCPSGFGYFMRGCIRRTQVEPTFTCSPGYAKVGNQCYSLTSVSALINCPEGYSRASPTYQSVDDVIDAHGTFDMTVCKKDLYYPPQFSCERNGLVVKMPGKVALTIHRNATDLNVASSQDEGLVEFLAHPECPRPIVRAAQKCPDENFWRMAAHEAMARLAGIHNRIIRNAHRGADDSKLTYLSALIENLAAMRPESSVCLSLTEKMGTLICPAGHNLVKISVENSLSLYHSICVEANSSNRALHERGKQGSRRKEKADSRRKGKEVNDNERHKRVLTEAVYVEPPRIADINAVTPTLKFEDGDLCNSLHPSDIMWENGLAICHEVKIAEPFFDCEKGKVMCKSLGDSGTEGKCTPVCDSSGDGDPAYLAKVLCDPGDVAGTKTVTNNGESITVPVCIKEERAMPELVCPFGIGSVTDYRCAALGVSDLLTSCPEGYTKATADKLGKKANVDQGYLTDKKNSKKVAPVTISDNPQVCELLEYADYQITCPSGYHREKARNTVHACVAEKQTKPSLVCPAGFMEAIDEPGHTTLDLSDERACIKIVEVAPTVISPSSPFSDDVVENYHQGSRGTMTACILTKEGGLSCGTERKYHAQTDIDAQEKFGQRYQDKYNRRTNKNK